MDEKPNQPFQLSFNASLKVLVLYRKRPAEHSHGIGGIRRVAQTSVRSCERIGGGEHLDFREGFTLLRRAVIARDNYGGRIESPSWFPPEP
jgi:hypothetical protein